MCIIAVKNTGIKLPTRTILKACFDSNPDGAGYMFARNGVVHIRKGFMSFRRFWKDYRMMHLSADDAICYHFRIATSGKVSPMNTHPFPITSNLSQLKACYTDCAFGMVHNGVLGVGRRIEKYFVSDTMEFIIDIMSKYSIRNNLQDNAIQILLENYIGRSRIAILQADSTIIRLGNNWIEDNGLWYSNKSYQQTYRPKTYHTPIYPVVDYSEYSEKSMCCPICHSNDILSGGYDSFECTICKTLFDSYGAIIE